MSAPASPGLLVGSQVVSAAASAFARCLREEAQPGCVTPPPTVAGTSAAATAPGAPGNLTVTVTGSTVVLSWTAPTIGDPAVEYVLEAGSGAGLANLLAGQATGGTAIVFTAQGVASGTYYVRVRAKNAAGQVSAASNEITVSVNVNNPRITFTAPAPSNGTAGQRYNFSFNAPGSVAGGVPPYHFQLDTAGGFPPIGLILDLNGLLSGTPSIAGTTSFKVCAVDVGGNSSCPLVTLTIDPAACTTAATPAGLTSTINGSTVTLQWPAAAGATSYVLEAGSSPGSSNIVPGSDVGNLTSYTAAGVGNGTYYIRVRARNACGALSAASSEVIATVGSLTFAGSVTAPFVTARPTIACSWSTTLKVTVTYRFSVGAGGTSVGNATVAGTLTGSAQSSNCLDQFDSINAVIPLAGTTGAMTFNGVIDRFSSGNVVTASFNGQYSSAANTVSGSLQFTYGGLDGQGQTSVNITAR